MARFQALNDASITEIVDAPQRANPKLTCINQTKDVSKKWPITKLGAAGFANPLFWCYRNAILQAMMNLPIFVNWIQTHTITQGSCPDFRKKIGGGKTPRKRCVACAFKRLSEAYWEEARNTKNVESVLADFNQVANNAGWEPKNKDEQADSHDFITQLVNYLGGTMPDDVTNAILKVEVLTRRKCVQKGCGHVHVQESTSQEFGLQIGITEPSKNLNIGKYLEGYFKSTTDADAKCDKCHVKSVMPRVVTIEAAPEVLILQFKRFQHKKIVHKRLGFRGYELTKLNSDVHFDMWLDLSKYQTNPAHREAGSLRYKLSSVVYHSGNGEGGHYMARVTSPMGVQLVNDLTVTKETLASLVQPHHGTLTPYVLVYTKC